MQFNRSVYSFVSLSLEGMLPTARTFPPQTSKTDAATLTEEGRGGRGRSVVFIDMGVVNYQCLMAGMQPETEVKLLASAGDAIAQISQYLAGQQGIASLHIVSHGEPGCLKFTGSRLDASNLGQYAAALHSWSEALVENAEILFYGCNVAKGDRGKAFVRQIGHLTGATVAASTNLTGNAALGGNWNLEFITGKIQAALAFSPSAMAAYPFVLPGQNILTESFAGADVTNFSWKYGNSGGLTTEPFLTARSSATISGPGGLLGGGADTPGTGALRLTNNNTQQGSFVIYNQPINASSGLSIAFDLYDYGGSTPGADGTSFFLIDGSKNPTQAGAVGGALGYSSGPTGPGLAGGYLGIGFDEFGNFSNPAYGSGGPGATPESVVLRGSDATGYKYLTGQTVPGGIDNPGANATRTNSKRHVQIDITPQGVVSVQLDNQQLISNFNTIAAGNTALPSTLKFGFSAATGNNTNFHDINNYVTNTESGAYTSLVNFTTTTATIDKNSPYLLTAQIDVPTTQNVTIPLNLSGTGANGTDYSIPTSITIAAGQKTGSVSIAGPNKTLVGPDKTLIVTLGTPSNAAVSPQNNTFTATIHEAPTTGGTPSNCPALDSNDLNGDGAADILWQNQATTQTGAWLMSGNTANSVGLTSVQSTDPNWQIVGKGDFTGNGRTDLLWQNKVTRQVGIWLMNGNTVSSTGLTTVQTTDSSWQIVGVGDFNHAGKADILWQNQATGQVGIWLMNQGAASTGFTVSSYGLTSVQNTDPNWQIAGVGDFTGTCKADILWRNKTTGQVGIWLMNLNAATSTGYTVSSYGLTSVQTTDLNWQIAGVGNFMGNNKSDLLWRNQATGQVGTWLMNVDPTTSTGYTVSSYGLTSVQNTDPNWQITEVGDFYGDGKADVLWQNKVASQVGTWRLNGSTVVSTGLTSVQNTDPNWQIVSV